MNFDFIKDALEFTKPYLDTALPLLFASLVIVFIITRFDDVTKKRRWVYSILTLVVAVSVYSFASLNQSNVEENEAIEMVEKALLNIDDATVYNDEANEQFEIHYSTAEKEVLIVTDETLKNLTVTYEKETYELKIKPANSEYGFEVTTK